MALVEMAVQPWGVVQDTQGNALNGVSVTIKNLNGTNATHYSNIAFAGASNTSLSTGSDGTLPRYIQEGTYTLTIGAQTRRVEASSGAVKVLREAPVNVMDSDFGAVNDGTGDQQAAVAAAVTRAKTASTGVGEVFIPPGNLRLATTLAGIDVSGLRIVGAGRRASIITLARSTAGNGLELGDAAGATRQHIELRDFGIVGDANTNYGIFLRDGCVQWSIRDVEVKSCTGTTGAGLGMAGGASQNYSGKVERSHFQSNKIGIEVTGKAQWLTIEGCFIYNNTVWGIDAMAEQGGTGGSRLHIVECEVEQNGLTADVTGSIRFRGIDNIGTIRSLYNEQGTAYPGIAILIDEDTDGIGCNQIAIVDSYFGGGTTQADAIILKRVTGINIERCRFASFTAAEPVRYSPITSTAVRNVRERFNNKDDTDVAGLFVGALDPRSGASSSAVVTANDIYLSAFEVPETRRVTKANIAVATQAGNVDVGIYDSAGNRVASSGSTAVAAAGLQQVTLSATTFLRPGRKYWAAVVCDNAAAALFYENIPAALAAMGGTIGVNTRIAAGGLPLPATVTIGTGQITRTYFVSFT